PKSAARQRPAVSARKTIPQNKACMQWGPRHNIDANWYGAAPQSKDWRMYLLLLVFGGLLGAAGVVLAGSGMSLRDGTFDAAILTPGIVAAAGGFFFMGVGGEFRMLALSERA